MCAIYGFLDYGKKVKHKALVKLLRELSIAAEVRGTDATGISYVNNGSIVTYKKAAPAHKLKLFFPKGTTSVIGHNRLTTKGNEKLNYNNHPFEGRTDSNSFALAHNGLLYNDVQLREKNCLPETVIETDSYIAVQLLEQQNSVDLDSLKEMAEAVTGSFVFTVLRDDNTLFLVRGNNPITLYHFEELGLYVYASTKAILEEALKAANFTEQHSEVRINEGEIVQLSPDGKISITDFDDHSYYTGYTRFLFDSEDDEFATEYLETTASVYGADYDNLLFLYECGYTLDELEEMIVEDVDYSEIITELQMMFGREEVS